MRLVETVIAVNRRIVAGEADARVPVHEFAAALPFAALTCIDARLNHLLPEMLGLPEEHFIWLRNAGNIITGPLSSTMRSLAMACAVKGAKEIAIIGHSDCLVGKTSTLQLLDRLAALGVDRHRLPENLVEYFGLFGSERQNVMKAVEHVRASPLIGAKIPVHGLVIELKSGQLEWIVNGYQSFQTSAVAAPRPGGKLPNDADEMRNALVRIGHPGTGELKVPATQIGEPAVASAGPPAPAATAAPAKPSPPAPPLLPADRLKLAAQRAPK